MLFVCFVAKLSIYTKINSSTMKGLWEKKTRKATHIIPDKKLCSTPVWRGWRHATIKPNLHTCPRSSELEEACSRLLRNAQHSWHAQRLLGDDEGILWASKISTLAKIIVGVVACSAVENDDGDEGAELKEKVNLQKFSLNISPWSKMELF